MLVFALSHGTWLATVLVAHEHVYWVSGALSAQVAFRQESCLQTGLASLARYWAKVRPLRGIATSAE